MKPRTIRTVLRIPLTTIPRGKVRKKLTEDGRVQDIKIFRSMTSIEVKKAISTGFENVVLEKFYYMKALQNNTLEFADNQELNGDGLIGLCGSGSLYITEVSNNY